MVTVTVVIHSFLHLQNHYMVTTFKITSIAMDESVLSVSNSLLSSSSCHDPAPTRSGSRSHVLYGPQKIHWQVTETSLKMLLMGSNKNIILTPQITIYWWKFSGDITWFEWVGLLAYYDIEKHCKHISLQPKNNKTMLEKCHTLQTVKVVIAGPEKFLLKYPTTCWLG